MDKIEVDSPFGKISQTDNGDYLMTDSQLYSEYEKRGLENAKEVLKAVDKTKQSFAKDVYQFLGEKVKESKQDQFLTAGTGNNRVEYGMLATKDINIPARDGESPKTETRYGYCTYKEQHKIPDAWKKDDGFLAKLSKEIENLMK